MYDISEEIQVFLQNVIDTRKLVFFVGAGISVPAGYPLWGAAAKSALEKAKARGLGNPAAAYAEDKCQKQQYYEFFQILQDELPEPTFYGIAEEVFQGGKDTADVHRLLARLDCRGIITTNFDSCLEVACAKEGKGMPLGDFPQAMASDKFYVLKPHGSLVTPRSMVLSRSDWKRVVDNRDLKELLAQCASSYQLAFIGYSMRDPDFNRSWNEILRERLFRSAAIYCCAKGQISTERVEEFRKRNVMVIEFPDDGSFVFVPQILQALLGRAPVQAAGQAPVTVSAERTAQDLERYVLISLQFSAAQQNRLVLVAKALVLESLVLSTTDLVRADSVFLHVLQALGLDSPLLRKATETALQELAEAGLVKIQGEEILRNTEKLKVLNDQASRLERAQAEWIDCALTEQADLLNVGVETGDRANVTQIVEKVLLEMGRQVAELFLFNRPPRDESERIDEVVEAFCGDRGLGARKELYKKSIKRMIFEPSDKDEDILFKKLQSYFISSAYVLDPLSEKLLSQYARDHWAFGPLHRAIRPRFSSFRHSWFTSCWGFPGPNRASVSWRSDKPGVLFNSSIISSAYIKNSYLQYMALSVPKPQIPLSSVAL